MKIPSIVIALFVSIIVSTQAQVAGTRIGSDQSSVLAPTAYRMVESGANHRVWQNETYEKTQDGQIRTSIHKYTELRSGLNYLNTQGQWVESKEKIEVYPGGAVARQGQHQVVFANNLNSYGAIDMQTPDGKRLRSNVLGLMYYDTATGDAVVIARLQDSEGQLISDNKVLYPNAFEGVLADVQYTYCKGSFEQDVILREQPPTPESLGLDSATTELEVFTEFVDAPVAKVHYEQADETSLEDDQSVDWGSVFLGRGKAFSLGTNQPQSSVIKRYMNIQGRNFLLEKISVMDIQPALSKLPEQASNGKSMPMMASQNPVLPQAPKTLTDSKPMKLALGVVPDKGYVLDYVAVTSSLGNYTFQGDTTYYISGTVNVTGTAVLEGGVVLKYGTNSSLNISGSVNCKTSSYRPAILTTKDDNSVGETIADSTGNPAANSFHDTGISYTDSYYACGCGSCGCQSAPYGCITLHDIRFSYLTIGISLTYGTEHIIRDAQFINCQSAVAAYQGFYHLRNVLVSGCAYADDSYNSFGFSCENVTFHGIQSISLLTSSGCCCCCCCCGSYLPYFYNSLLVGSFTSGLSVPGSNNRLLTSDIGVFQTAGAGSHYLTGNSSYRGIGTTNIDATLLADLRIRTTYAPLVYSNGVISTNLTLTPYVSRDTGAAPDLGYHYAPLDYLVDNLAVTNATLAVSNGVAMACYNEPGIQLNNGSALVSVGTPLSPNWYVRYQSVQEQSVKLGGTNVSAGMPINAVGNPTAVFQFSKFACPAGGGSHLYDANTSAYGNLMVQNCEFWSGKNDFTGDANTVATLVNNLFWRSTLTASNANLSSTLALSNNLAYGATVNLSQPANTIWYAFNNAFDTCTLTNSTLTNGYNAYLASSGRLYPTNSHDVLQTTTLSYASSWLGDFYQPTSSPLINKGSTTADQVALYHFTTQTNQFKETNSIVDIGYHYVATDGYGNPYDTDGDGLPDYLEDTNGNGIFDAGDLGNWLLSPFNGLNSNNGLSVFTPLK